MLLDANSIHYQKQKDCNAIFSEMFVLPNGTAAALITVHASEIPYIIVALMAAVTAISLDEYHHKDKSDKISMLTQLAESLVPNETQFDRIMN